MLPELSVPKREVNGPALLLTNMLCVMEVRSGLTGDDCGISEIDCDMAAPLVKSERIQEVAFCGVELCADGALTAEEGARP